MNVVIAGATSAIAVGFAREMARRGGALHLVARDADELERIASDISIRHGVRVTWSVLDANEDAGAALEAAVQSLGTVDGVMFATGMLGDQAEAEANAEVAARIAEINYISGIRFLTGAANYLAERKSGWCVVVCSVAGDRGRPSNYVYGSSKGALALFAQGLRARMAKVGVHVMTVKPGFVDTKMTFGKKGMFLVANPDDVGKAIAHGLDARRDVLYVPAFWWAIMTIIKNIPEPIFKKMKL